MISKFIDRLHQVTWETLVEFAQVLDDIDYTKERLVQASSLAGIDEAKFQKHAWKHFAKLDQYRRRRGWLRWKIRLLRFLLWATSPLIRE